MKYITPDNEYPRYYGDIQLQHPGWQLGDELPQGWRAVYESKHPEIGENQYIDEQFPIEIEGVYYENWVVLDMTPEQIEQKNAPKTAKEKLIALGLTEIEVAALAKGLIR